MYKINVQDIGEYMQGISEHNKDVEMLMAGGNGRDIENRNMM